MGTHQSKSVTDMKSETIQSSAQSETVTDNEDGSELWQSHDMTGLSDTPNVVLLHLASYLSPEDTVRLAMTCRRFYSILPSFLVMEGEDFHVEGPTYTQSVRHGAPPEIYFDGPPLSSPVKKITLSVVWKDQGWGNLKGELFIQLMRSLEANEDKKKELKVVAEKRRVFGIAKHHQEEAKTELVDEEIVTLSQAGDFYRFMRNIGGGGGHTLTVTKFRAVATQTQKTI